MNSFKAICRISYLGCLVLSGRDRDELQQQQYSAMADQVGNRPSGQCAEGLLMGGKSPYDSDAISMCAPAIMHARHPTGEWYAKLSVLCASSRGPLTV